MRIRILLFIAAVGLTSVYEQTTTGSALAGQVRSSEEGAMEGVLVSAKRAGSTITITVVSDSKGRYSFPRTRLESGPYSIRVPAAGQELEDPGWIEIEPGQ